MPKETKSIILIRRDNIGDLVCTTPAIRALRLKFPDARICALVNSYNAGSIANNPDVDEVFVYEKEKHAGGRGRLRVLLGNLNLMRKVRARRFDVAVGCSYSWSPRLARYTYLTGARLRIGYVKHGGGSRLYNAGVPEPGQPVHEVEAMMRLLAPLGVSGPTPSLYIGPDEEELKKADRYIKTMGADGRIAALHISSRKPRNRWPVESFMSLGDRIEEEFGLKVMLLWSPGSSNNPLHPGDDEKAERLLLSMKKRPLAYRTENLSELVAAMSLAKIVVCCDGGAMHIAAALGKPILSIWGTTDRRRWAPWGVPHVILQKGGSAGEVSAEEAFAAFRKFYLKQFAGEKGLDRA